MNEVMDAEKMLTTLELCSKTLQLKMLNGDASWDDQEVQFFIPVVLYFTNFEWLRLIAENHLIEEDEKIVKNFLSFCESLRDVNNQQMHNEAMKKMRGF